MEKLWCCFVILGLWSCSSADKKNKDVGAEKAEQVAGDEENNNDNKVQRDFVVREASQSHRPAWSNDPSVWAKEQGEDVARFRFFSFETTPKIDREIACSLAKTNVKADIAGEIASFIDKTLAESKEGQSSISDQDAQGRSLREFISVTLAEKTQALIHGATIIKTYWEKRQYQTALGARRDYVGYICAVLMKIESDRLKRAVDEAAEHVVKAVDDPDTKENVRKALEDVSKNFMRARQGTI